MSEQVSVEEQLINRLALRLGQAQAQNELLAMQLEHALERLRAAGLDPADPSGPSVDASEPIFATMANGDRVPVPASPAARE